MREESISKFIEVFTGLTVAYGKFVADPASEGSGKVEGSFEIVREEVTKGLWLDHLNGKSELSICPIDEDNKCRWGCIDIDDYSVDHKHLVKIIEDNNLPFVVCRSKSGGARLYVFLKKSIPAKEVKKKLKELAAVLGHAEAEFFPKQATLLLDKGEVGSPLILPYFDANQTMRYAYNDKGIAITTLDGLLEFIEKKQVGRREFNNLKVDLADDDLKEAPICLVALLLQNVVEGNRNTVLFNMATYCKKRYGEKFEKHLEKLNQKYFKPALKAAEVTTILKKAAKTEYQYQCNVQPLCQYCDRAKCMQRKYGVGGDKFVDMGGLVKVKSDPTLWFLDVDDKRIELLTSELQSQSAFQLKCMDVLNLAPPIVKQNIWLEQVNDLMANVIELEAPYEATFEGMVKEQLDIFLSLDNSKLGSREDLAMLGKNYFDEDAGLIYFKLSKFMEHLKRVQFENMKRNKISNKIRELGGKSGYLKCGTESISCYIITPPSMAVTELPIPEIDEGNI